MYFATEGAYTGEISPLMLFGLCEYVILGHSERRIYFGETDEIVNKKIQCALKHNLKPILCVGESLTEKESLKTEEILSKQLTKGLQEIICTKDLLIAYEPLWAIGTGMAANGEEASVTTKFIRDKISCIWNKTVAHDIRILYGGSVKSNNIIEFISQSDIDGVLVGGASLKAQEFLSIANQIANYQK
jgi:triosephosphate isomerase